MLSSAASLTIAQGSSPDPRTTIESLSRCARCLSGVKTSQTKSTVAPSCDRGRSEIAAHQIPGRRRRSQRDLALRCGLVEALVETGGQFSRRALDRNDRHRRAGHAGVRAPRELLTAFDAGSDVAGGFDAAAVPPGRSATRGGPAPKPCAGRPRRRDCRPRWNTPAPPSRPRSGRPSVNETLTRPRLLAPFRREVQPGPCGRLTPARYSQGRGPGLDRRHDRRAEKLSSGRGAGSRSPGRGGAGAGTRAGRRSPRHRPRRSRRPTRAVSRAAPKRSRISGVTRRSGLASTA